MADNLTDTAERLMLDWLNGASPTQPVGPLKVRLMTANGTDSTAGTEMTGDLYSPQSAGFGAATTASGISKIANVAAISFAGLDSAGSRTVTGVSIWDSSGSPVRLAYGPLSASVVVPAGQGFAIDPGALTLTLT